jgi:hypothetical protein
MRLHLRIWRQAGPDAAGRLVDYTAERVNPDMSFLEMLDVVNDDLMRKGEDPIAFDSDCREGICGSCGLMVNGLAHGPERGGTVCQLHMRRFRDGDTITIEPWRAAAFPVIKDLVVDRTAFDRIIAAGGFISVNTVYRLRRMCGRVQECVGVAVRWGQGVSSWTDASGAGRAAVARRGDGRSNGHRGLRALQQ